MKFKTLAIFKAFYLTGGADGMDSFSDAVRTKFQFSSFMAPQTPFLVLMAFAIFSGAPGGQLAGLISKMTGTLQGLGLTTLAFGVPVLMNPTPCQKPILGPMEICHI